MLSVPSELPTADLPVPRTERTPLGADPTFAARWARLRAGVRSGGVEYVVTAALSYLPWWLVLHQHHVLLACVARDLGCAEVARRVVRSATPSDAEKLVGHGELTRELVDRQFASEDACVMIQEGGRVLASTWAATGTRYLLELSQTFELGPDAYYIHASFTEPDVRRRGLATLCYQWLFDLMMRDGRRKAYAAVAVLNHASLRAHAKWGFVPVGRSRTFSALGLRVTFCPRWPVRNRRFRVESRWTRAPYPPA